ncbi:hypothetical protein [Streptomyces mirabilis]
MHVEPALEQQSGSVVTYVADTSTAAWTTRTESGSRASRTR